MPPILVYTTVMSMTFTFQNSSFKVHQVSLDGTPWFRGKDVAVLLGYRDTRHAIRVNVEDDDKRHLCEVCSSAATSNDRNTIYINEAGVRRLVIKSQKQQASELAKQLGDQGGDAVPQKGDRDRGLYSRDADASHDPL